MSSKPKSLKKGQLNDAEKVYIVENRFEKTVEEIAEHLNRSETSVKGYLKKVDPPETKEVKSTKVVETDPDFSTTSHKKTETQQTGVATVMTGAASAVKVKTKRSEFLREGY